MNKKRKVQEGLASNVKLPVSSKSYAVSSEVFP